MKIVQVDWLDTMGDLGWKSSKHKLDPKDMLQHSIGYLLENSKQQVVICQSYGEIDNCAERLQIPKCAVKRVRKLNAQTTQR